MSYGAARVAPEKAVFRPALPMSFQPGLNGTDMTKLTYWEQLLHPIWQRKRLETLEDAAWTCEICEATEVTLHVHHRRYIKGRMVWEYDRDALQVLCADCHAAEHAARATLDRVTQAARYIGYGGARKPELVAAALLAGFTRQCVGGEIDDEAYQAAGEGEQGRLNGLVCGI